MGLEWNYALLKINKDLAWPVPFVNIVNTVW